MPKKVKIEEMQHLAERLYEIQKDLPKNDFIDKAIKIACAWNALENTLSKKDFDEITKILDNAQRADSVLDTTKEEANGRRADCCEMIYLWIKEHSVAPVLHHGKRKQDIVIDDEESAERNKEFAEHRRRIKRVLSAVRAFIISFAIYSLLAQAVIFFIEQVQIGSGAILPKGNAEWFKTINYYFWYFFAPCIFVSIASTGLFFASKRKDSRIWWFVSFGSALVYYLQRSLFDNTRKANSPASRKGAQVIWFSLKIIFTVAFGVLNTFLELPIGLFKDSLSISGYFLWLALILLATIAGTVLETKINTKIEGDQ